MNKNLNVVIFSILRILSSFFVLLFLSRYLSKNTFGMYNYFIAFSTIALTILFNGFTPIYLRNKLFASDNPQSNKVLYNQILLFFFTLLIIFNIIFNVAENAVDLNIQIILLNIFLISGFFHHIVLQEVRSQKKFFNLSLILFLEKFIFLLVVIFIYTKKINLNIILIYVVFYVFFTVFILIFTKNIGRFLIIKVEKFIFSNLKVLISSYFKNSFSILTNSLANQSFLIFIVGFLISLEKSADIAIAFQLLSIIIFTVIWVELILPIKYMDLIKKNDLNGFNIFFKNKVTKYYLIIIFFSTIYLELLSRTDLIEFLFTDKYADSIHEISILSIVAISQCFEIFISWYLLSFKKETTLMKISIIKLITFFIFLIFGNYDAILFGFAISFVFYFIIGFSYMKKHISLFDFYTIGYFYFLFVIYNILKYLSIISISEIILFILISSSVVYIIANIKIYYFELKNLLKLNGNN